MAQVIALKTTETKGWYDVVNVHIGTMTNVQLYTHVTVVPINKYTVHW